jgi:hypothetical protein
MVGKASPIGFVSPPMFLALRLTAGRLRESFWRFPQRYCDFADVFGSPPIVSCLRPLSLPLRKCFCVFYHYLCFFANDRESPAIVFVSSPMVVISSIIVFASAIALFHSLKGLHPAFDIPKAAVRSFAFRSLSDYSQT